MNFEVKGQSYVLTFLPSEGSFALFETDGEEVHRMKIVHDDGPTFVSKVEDAGSERKRSLN